jgi:arylsulfatase
MLTVLCGCQGARPTTPEHLILISIDTLRPDHLGSYGYARPTSPTLDAIARAGTRFANVTSASPWTLPSHVSLLTGLYPSRHGVKARHHRMTEATPSLAAMLKARGFQTMGASSVVTVSAHFGLDQGFETFRHFDEFGVGADGERIIVNNAAPMVAQALEWLRGRDGRRFFLFLHFYDVHSDFAPEPEYSRMFEAPYAGPIDGTTAQLVRIRRDRTTIPAAGLKRLRDLYDAEIRQLDDTLGHLVAFLEAGDLLDRTLVVVTADHGEEFQEHGSVLHGRTYFQEVIAIPLLLRGPGVPVGVEDYPASIIDVVPTVLSLLGVDPSETVPDMDGVDLTALWRDREGLPRERVLYAEADHNNAEDDMFRMAREGRFKLIFDRLAGTSELFDLEADPAESDDLSARETARAEAMRAHLARFLTGEAIGADFGEPDPEVIEALQALGYVR